MTPSELRAIRLRLNLTQADMARQIGASPATVRAWEAGRRSITGMAAIAIGGIRPAGNTYGPRQGPRSRQIPDRGG